MAPEVPEADRQGPVSHAVRSLTSGILILVPGLLGYAAGYPWLFPSLGPSIFLHTISPHDKSARVYNTFAGHLIGIACGYLAVWAVGAASTPSPLTSGHLVLSRVWASSIAVALTVLLQLFAKATHAPAAATTLLIALGAFKASWKDLSVLLAGIAIATAAGEAARRVLLRKGQ